MQLITQDFTHIDHFVYRGKQKNNPVLNDGRKTISQLQNQNSEKKLHGYKIGLAGVREHTSRVRHHLNRYTAVMMINHTQRHGAKREALLLFFSNIFTPPGKSLPHISTYTYI